MTREALLNLLDHPAAERLGWTLLHFLWQGAAVAVVLMVALWLLRRRSAQARYAACCAALSAMALLPVVTFLLTMPTQGESVAAVRRARAGGAVYLGPAEVPQGVGDAQPASESSARVAFEAPVVSWLACVWAGGVLALAFWHAGGWVHLRRRLRRETQPVEGVLREALDELSAALGVSRRVRLVEAARVQVPAVVGALRPVLLFPAAALTGLTPGQLRALLAHELAHVRRHDYAVNLLQTMLQTLLFYHPAVWWASARMREEREYCCDDVAAAASGDRVTYARALATMEELRALPVGLALAARGGSLLRRVQRLLGVAPSPGAARGRNRSIAAAALAVALAALPLAAPRLRAGSASDAPSKPTTRPAVPEKGPAAGPAESAVTPEDLVAEAKDYEIQPNDLVSVMIADLLGPGKETVKNTRVGQGGTVSLPFVGQIKVGGMTEAAAEKVIAKAYLEQNLLQNAQVGVAVVEARGRSFSIIGDAGRPGQYSIQQPDFRLLDAMAVAAVDPKVDGLFVLRKVPDDAAKAGGPPPQARKIRVPMQRLAAGDMDVNLVIRPGDLIVVEGGLAKTARLVVGPDGVTFGGKAMKWEELAAALGAVPLSERRRTTITISPATTDLTLRQYGQARDRAAALARQLGFAGTADDAFEGAGGGGAPRPAPAKEGGPVAGEPPGPLVPYYIGGHLPHPGGDSVGGRGATLRQALMAAGVAENSDDVGQVHILRRGVAAPGDQLTVDGAALMKDGKGDLPLQSGDRILVTRKEKAGP